MNRLRDLEVSLFSWSVEQNARDTQMTTRVTEGERRERPLFLASRGSRARALLLLDLLTSRAFERVARSYERRARSASERAKVRAGSYHTRPENHANDFEEVYPLSKSEEKERLLAV